MTEIVACDMHSRAGSSVVELVQCAQSSSITLQKQTESPTPNPTNPNEQTNKNQRRAVPLDVEVAGRWEKVRRGHAMVISEVGSYKAVHGNAVYTLHNRSANIPWTGIQRE